jgi:hypothetical protein
VIETGPPLLTPDGRYLVVRGRLWRAANPGLSAEQRERLVKQLMAARRDVGAGKRECDRALEREARRRVHRAKLALGERGPVWWSDGAADFNRTLVRNSPYASWFASACGANASPGRERSVSKGEDS